MRDKSSPLTCPDLAVILECDLKTIHRWIADKRLRVVHHTLGGQARFNAASVLRDYRRAKLTPPPALVQLARAAQ